MALLCLGTAGRSLIESLLTRLAFTPFIAMGLLIVYCNVAFIETAMALARTREKPWRYVAINLGRAGPTTGLVIGALVGHRLTAEAVVGSQLIASVAVAGICAALMWRVSPPLADRRTGVPVGSIQPAARSAGCVAMGAAHAGPRDPRQVRRSERHRRLRHGISAGQPLSALDAGGSPDHSPGDEPGRLDPARKVEAQRGIAQYLGVSLPLALLGMLVLPVLTPVVLPDAYHEAGRVGQWVLAGMLATAVFQLAVDAGALYRGKFASLTVLTICGAAGNVVRPGLDPTVRHFGRSSGRFPFGHVDGGDGVSRQPLAELLRGRTLRLILIALLGSGVFSLGERYRPGSAVLALTVAIVLSCGYAACSYAFFIRVQTTKLSGPEGSDVGPTSTA